MNEVVITGAARTAIGSFGGALASVPATRLGAIAIKEALKRAALSPDQVNEVIMGCVLTSGLGQAPARQAAIYAGLPQSVHCFTIGKVCGSGLKAVMLAAQAIACGDADVVIAGGMESMSRAPYLLPDARSGMRMGHKQVVDSMINDGLWDPYNDFHMGEAAELCAEKYGYTREIQDAFAAESYRKALEAQAQGRFKAEIVPVEVPQRKGNPVIVDEDEEPRRGDVSRFAKLRPAFKPDGTVTAANASSLNDGAAAVVLTSRAYAEEHGLPILGRIAGKSEHSQAPEWFTTAPAGAVDKVLKKLALKPEDIDLYEVNEAFSVVTLSCQELCHLPQDRINVNGGAVALGHPIGASGARILVSLLYAMEQQNKKRGLATLCIGGGEAVAVVVER